MILIYTFIASSTLMLLVINAIFDFNTYPIFTVITSVLAGLFCVLVVNTHFELNNSIRKKWNPTIRISAQFIGILLFSFFLLYKLYPEYILQCIAWALIASMASVSSANLAKSYAKTILIQSIVGATIIYLTLGGIIFLIGGMHAFDLSPEGERLRQGIEYLLKWVPIFSALWYAIMHILLKHKT